MDEDEGELLNARIDACLCDICAFLPTGGSLCVRTELSSVGGNRLVGSVTIPGMERIVVDRSLIETPEPSTRAYQPIVGDERIPGEARPSALRRNFSRGR